MKTTLDIDDALYRQLKAHAALNGTSIRALITDAINRLLSNHVSVDQSRTSVRETPPPWLGSLSEYAANASGKHDLVSMRASVAKGRTRK